MRSIFDRQSLTKGLASLSVTALLACGRPDDAQLNGQRGQPAQNVAADCCQEFGDQSPGYRVPLD